MGRVVRQQDRNEGGAIVYDRRLGDTNGRYQRDGDGRIWKETVVQVQGSSTVGYQ